MTEEMNQKILVELCECHNPNDPHGDTYEYGQYAGFEDGFMDGFELALKAIKNKWTCAGKVMIQDIYEELINNKNKY